MEETLYGAISTLFNSLPDGRTGYVRDVEQSLSHLVMFSREYNAEIDWESVVYEALFSHYGAGLNEILSVLSDPELTAEAREEQATQIALEHIADATLRQTGTDLTQTMSALQDLTHAMVVSMMADPQQMTSFLYQIIENNGIRAHYPEVMLANLMAQDSYYNEEKLFGPQPDSYRIADLAGVGDVTIYTEDGTVLAQRRGKTVENTSAVHGLAITDENTIRVILPSDASYTIELTADTDDVAVSLCEYSSMWQQRTRQQSYCPAAVHGEILRLDLPAYNTADYADPERDGSDTIYTLTDPAGREIVPGQ